MKRRKLMSARITVEFIGVERWVEIISSALQERYAGNCSEKSIDGREQRSIFRCGQSGSRNVDGVALYPASSNWFQNVWRGTIKQVMCSGKAKSVLK